MYPFKYLLTACLVLAGYIAAAQVNQQPDSSGQNAKAFTTVETEASYPGGIEAWQKFLQKNLNSNIPNKNKAPIGRYMVIVKFIADKDGVLSNIRPETNFGFGMEEEVVRVIEQSGKWNPAIQNGKPINDFEITTVEPYTLFANADNGITVTAKKIKPADISIAVQGGKSTPVADGKFIVRVSKAGRVTIVIVNNKKDDKEIGIASFEVKAK
jgi:hypothetical protein